METQLKLMGQRLREIRTVLEIPVSEMAKVTGVTEEEYLKHEEGLVDSTFSFLHYAARRFGVDLRALLTGETPKLSYFALTRNNEGMPIKRRKGLNYWHLAASVKNRHAEPFFMRTAPQPDNSPIPLSTHSGHEFDYIIKGTLKFQLDNKVEILKPGDSIYYEASRPHGMIAVGDEECEFLAIIIKSDNEDPVEIKQLETDSGPAVNRQLIYKQFVDETVDEKGHLTGIKFHYPDNYNFAFDVVDALAKKDPAKKALVWLSKNHELKEFTFKDISEMSSMAANYFLSLGIRKGDRVMMVCKRHYQTWVILAALCKIGAIAIPASAQLITKDFDYRFKSANVKCVICSVDEKIAYYADEAIKSCPFVELKIAVNGAREGWHNFDEEIKLFSKEFKRPTDQKATDTAMIFFSSGTTGYPKMLVHPHTYSLGHVVTARWWQNVNPDGLHLTISDAGWGKFFWGKIYGQWLCEATVFAYDFDRFDAHDILGLFKKYNITTFCAPPTMYRFFIKDDLSQHDLSSIKYSCIAGEALNPEVFQKWYEATGLKLMEGFGQTESNVLVGNFIGMNPKPGSMGRPSPQYDISLVDADGNPVRDGEVGEIVIKTAPYQNCGLFVGYGGKNGEVDKEKTAEMWHDGYYHTGDTAWRDEDGYFWYVGRTDDLIKSSGYRIGPFEIESVIMELPYVLECAVIGVPDPTRGQVVKAAIVLTKGTNGTDELKKEIQEYVKTHTAPYKYPRVIEFMEALPKTPSGKIKRGELRKAGR